MGPNFLEIVCGLVMIAYKAGLTEGRMEALNDPIAAIIFVRGDCLL